MSDNASTTRTLAGYTHCWDGGRPHVIPHLIHQGRMLTPRIETTAGPAGRRIARTILGWPVVERTLAGSVIYATPGGGVFVL